MEEIAKLFPSFPRESVEFYKQAVMFLQNNNCEKAISPFIHSPLTYFSSPSITIITTHTCYSPPLSLVSFPPEPQPPSVPTPTITTHPFVSVSPHPYNSPRAESLEGVLRVMGRKSSLFHLISGLGNPSATQRRVTLSPSLTVVSDDVLLLMSGGTVGKRHRTSE